jgi:hypothetical protein
MAKLRFGVVAGLAALALSAVSCTAGSVHIGDPTQGSGVSKSETRSVSGFNRINVSLNSTVTVNRTGSESLTVQADDNLLPMITSTVSGGTLNIGFSNTFGAKGAIVLTITARNLNEVDLNGDGKVTAGNIVGPAFKTSINGTGSVILAGQAQSQTIELAGDGTYDGAKFVTSSAAVTINGSGKAIVNARDSLDTNTVDPATVDYIGRPRVTNHGRGAVRPLGDA